MQGTWALFSAMTVAATMGCGGSSPGTGSGGGSGGVNLLYTNSSIVYRMVAGGGNDVSMAADFDHDVTAIIDPRRPLAPRRIGIGLLDRLHRRAAGTGRTERDIGRLGGHIRGRRFTAIDEFRVGEQAAQRFFNPVV